MTHPEPRGCDPFTELLGVYAVDALDPDEATLVAAHLRSCPRCAQEVDEHREAIALLAAGGGQAPDGLWERIAESISPEAGAVIPRPAPDVVSKSRRRRRGTSLFWSGGIAAAAALAAIVGVQTARVDHLNHRVDQLNTAVRQTGSLPGIAAALVDPSAHHYTLVSANNGRPVGQVIVLPSGTSYLVGSRLPRLSSELTYQLWSLVGSRPVSVSLLGSDPVTVAFRVDPSAPTAAYLVTVEAAGGVATPSGDPVAKTTT